MFVGHSLGGGLAAIQSMATGKQAITFNASGANVDTLTRMGLRSFGTDNITAISVKGDPLNEYQDAIPGLTNAQGWRHELPARYNLTADGWQAGQARTYMSRGAMFAFSGAQHSRAQLTNAVLDKYFFGKAPK